MISRRARAVVVALSMVVIAAIGPARTANAGPMADTLGNPDCPHGGNYVSTACLLYLNPYSDIYAEWHTNFMSVDYTLEGQGAHINHTIWMYSSSPCTSFVEIGITRGFLGEHATRWYYGYEDQTVGIAFAYGSDYTTFDGVNHSY